MSATEFELRYHLDGEFSPPSTLLGVPFLGSQISSHVDMYWDRDGVLDKQGIRLRTRLLDDGRAVLTVKVKRARRGSVRVRDEHNKAIDLPLHWNDASDLHCNWQAMKMPDSDVVSRLRGRFLAGKNVRGTAWLRVDRVDHHYLQRDGLHIVLSEDHILYADGGRERRLEAEFKEGDDRLLHAVDTELRMNFSLLECQNGKASEAIRRLYAASTRA